mmetsp:Transcript_44903/g.73158  ORF Transcript_44903/g.73158 Transcript_44903/m.73158 type:complete len:212 (-) Transcript_44903:1400-2035(-)
MVYTQSAEVVDKELWIDELSVDDAPLDVCNVGEVFERLLVQACLFTKLGDLWPVEMGEHLRIKDSICHLRGLEKIDLKELGLQGSFLRPVVLEDLQQEPGGFLYAASLHEHIHHRVRIYKRTTRGIGKQKSKLCRPFLIEGQQVGKQLGPARVDACALGICDDFVVLARLKQRLYNLCWYVGFEIYCQGHLGILLLHQISQILAHFELILP